MSEDRLTYCRICEALCGMVATVQDGRVVKLRPDREHPLSRGYACPKGIAMAEVQEDPDRVVHPLRRRPDGQGFKRVSWDDALADIGGRLRDVIARHGGESVGWYAGNPSAFSYSHTLWVKGFVDALGSSHHYTASSQDVANRFAASALMYGTPVLIPIPDLKRTDLAVLMGANPLVSHGSVLTAPRIKDELHGIVARGGRVVAVDPRRSETARAFEHVPIRPDADAWLLLAVLNVLFAEGLADEDALARQATGVAWLRNAASAPVVAPEAVADRTGVDSDSIRALARDLAAAPRAAVYGRTGTCLGRFGTLTAYLIDAVNLVLGNLDAPGGAVFGHSPIPLEVIGDRGGLATYAERRSRVGGFPDVIGSMPASLMAEEIRTPGRGQLRALFVSAGNPVLSVPDGDGLTAALGELDLLVSLDLYINETNTHADYVLPATTFLEREDLPLALMGFGLVPHAQWTEPVVAPRGEARPEWEVVAALADAAGIIPLPHPLARRLPERLARRLTPRRLVDLLLRTGPDGDLFGLRRRGLSLARLRAEPRGRVLHPHVPTGVLTSKLRTQDRRVRLDAPALRDELARMLADGVEETGRRDDFPLRLIGLRELRSHNSWMHNSPLLTRGGRTFGARVHPDDAARAGLTDAAPVRLSSPWGEIRLPVILTDEMTPGTVAVPHGWGHAGGWERANALGGVNVNALASRAAEDLEPLAGMAFLNGIPVRLEPA